MIYLKPNSKCLKFKALFYASLIGLFVTACGQKSENKTADTTDTVETEKVKPVVEITARGLEFEGPDSIPSGWNTIRFNNPSGMTHLILIGKYPDGKGLKDHQEIVAPIFQNFMDDINGKPLSAPEAGMELPEWFSEVKYYGGPGLLSAEHISETTVNLDPGTYVFECYVKTNGVFHSYSPVADVNGMAIEIIVTEEKSNVNPPVPSFSIDVSSEKGIEVNGTPAMGEQVVQVNFIDQKVYGHFLGHDVHVVELDNIEDIQEVASWMNWANPSGLETPAPAKFLGGANEMPAGSTAYFTVNLDEGNYAWVAEVPNPDSVGMLKTFTIPAEEMQ
ncbi:MAG: hypothetical protein R3345_15305 [Fulvivirga sp.]|nr:hypothetical protein [Fulvivirga sp.]